jgi:hypothetical protein
VEASRPAALALCRGPILQFLLGMLLVVLGMRAAQAQQELRITDLSFTDPMSLMLRWSGGTAPYVLLRKKVLADPNWAGVFIARDQSATLPVGADRGPGFFRVMQLRDIGQVVSVRRIWSGAPHNAFTALARFNGRWVCAFREGADHLSFDGIVRVLVSDDGVSWTSAGAISIPGKDLRDPKLSVAPDNTLRLNCAARTSSPDFQSLVFSSSDASNWSPALAIGTPNEWLWKVVWGRDAAYSLAYDTQKMQLTQLYRSWDGSNFAPIVSNVTGQTGNECAIDFGFDGKAVALLRRDPSSALLGASAPPYGNWTWRDLGLRVGGPQMIWLPDGRLLAAGRLYEGGTRTALMLLLPETGQIGEFLSLPSGGDTGYPGLAWYGGDLWVSYYSSHEGKASIYFAQVRLASW